MLGFFSDKKQPTPYEQRQITAAQERLIRDKELLCSMYNEMGPDAINKALDIAALVDSIDNASPRGDNRLGIVLSSTLSLKLNNNPKTYGLKRHIIEEVQQ